MPALFTSTSIRPNRASTPATIRSNAAGSARSVPTACNTPRTWHARAAAATSASPSALRSTPATSMPAISSPSVIARPNPLAAPVTIATGPFSDIGIASVLRGRVLQNQPPRSRGGQPDAHRRSDTHFALDRQLAAMAVDDMLHDGQPKPGAAHRARPASVHAVEPLRQPRQVLTRNAVPLIGDRHNHPRPHRPAWPRRRLGRQPHRAALTPILYGVVQQLLRDLGQLVDVAQHRRQPPHHRQI